MHVHHVTTVEAYYQLIQELYKHKLISLDYEFTSLDVYAATLLLMSIAWNDQESYVIDFTIIPVEQLKKLKPILENPDVLVLAHNATVEWRYTYHFSRIEIAKVHDTMVCEQLIFAGLNYRFDLKSVSEHRLGIVRNKEIRKEFTEWQPGQLFTQEQINYSGEDVTTLFEIYRQQMEDITSRELNRIYDLEMAIIAPTALMEHTGIPVNRSMLEEMIDPFNRFAGSAEHAFQDVLLQNGAADEILFSKDGYSVINANSPLQVKESLAKLGIEPRDVSGKLSLNSKVVQRWDMQQSVKKGKKHKEWEIDYHALLDDEEVADALDLYSILDNKILRAYVFMVGARKLVNTFVLGLLELINPKTKRIHPNFRSCGAHRTGRYSSTNPNGQNIPNDIKLKLLGLGKYSIRKTFEAPKGRKLVISDFSGIELVILAVLSNDDKLLDQILRGDVHSYVVREIFEIRDINDSNKKQEPYKSWRQGAKRTSYSNAYGSTGRNLAEQLNIDLANVGKKFTHKEGDEIIEKWFKLFPKTAKYLESNARHAITRFYTTDSWNRRRNWDKKILYPISTDKQVLNDAKWKRFAAMREAKNASIQSTSATMTKRAIQLVWERLDKKRARMIMVVHDEIVVESVDGYVETAKKIIKESMEQAIQETLPSIADLVGKYESLSVDPKESERYDK